MQFLFRKLRYNSAKVEVSQEGSDWSDDRSHGSRRPVESLLHTR
jgi:hypothetical protein